jgi:sulfate permease, SulP family
VTRPLSSPVLMGYLAGAAIVIVSSQLPKIFGISLEGTSRFEIIELLQRFNEWNWSAFAIGVASATAMALIQRFATKLPAALIAITLATGVFVAFDLDARADVAAVGKFAPGCPCSPRSEA